MADALSGHGDQHVRARRRRAPAATATAEAGHISAVFFPPLTLRPCPPAREGFFQASNPKQENKKRGNAIRHTIVARTFFCFENAFHQKRVDYLVRGWF